MLVRGADFNEAGGLSARARSCLRLSERPTAIFAANDLMAMGAMAAIREAGLRIPDDVAIVGFDDVPAARLVEPPLTTIAQYPERLGARAAELLLERLSGDGPPEGRHVLMPFDLIVRRPRSASEPLEEVGAREPSFRSRTMHGAGSGVGRPTFRNARNPS